MNGPAILGTLHGRYAWYSIWNRMMGHQRNKRGPFSFRFTLIFLFSNWYLPHHPIYWVILHLTVFIAPGIWLMHCVKYGHDSRLEIGRWAHKGNTQSPLSFGSIQLSMVSCSSSNTFGHLSCRNLKWWMALLFLVHCMEDKHDIAFEIGWWAIKETKEVHLALDSHSSSYYQLVLCSTSKILGHSP